MKNRIICIILTAILLLSMLVSCGAKNSADKKEEAGVPTGGAPAVEAPTDGGTAAKDGSDHELIEDFSASLEGELKGESDLMLDASADVMDPGASASEEIDSSSPTKNEIEAGTLTAGEWKDNDNYDFWCSLFEREEWKGYADLWRLIPNMRFAVTLTNGQNAAKNVRVEMYAGEHLLASAVSDSYGKAYLNPHLTTNNPEGDLVGADRLVVYFEGGSSEYPITPDDLAAGGISITDVEGKRHAALDLMFVVDTTGSMGDELEYLKKELGNVISTVSDENEELDISLSLNFYRDEGDEYVVRSNEFTSDIDGALKILDGEYSDGGGDYPEAVHTALEDALNGHEWRQDSVKLMFLVLDAPPHSESEEVVDSVRQSITEAAEKGVRIIPIASSGVDTETEFLLRIMSLATGGTYTFLTDHSGVGESHLEPTIGDYNVKKLNDLLVKIINEYCK